MDLKELVQKQQRFDAKHGWVPQSGDLADVISFLLQDTVGLAGEVGEVAGLVKKIGMESRHDRTCLTALVQDNKADIAEELVDVLIYVARIAGYLKIDLESEYISKLAVNEKRFKRFES